MKFFQPTLLPRPLGLLLQEARMNRKLKPEAVAKALHLSLEEIAALEADKPLDLRRARIQAVSYLRFLGMNPTDYKDSLPELPELLPVRDRVQVRETNPIIQAVLMMLSMLAPMGRLALSLIIIAILLSSWGLVRQLSRVREMPWVSYTYTIHDSSTR